MFPFPSSAGSYGPALELGSSHTGLIGVGAPVLQHASLRELSFFAYNVGAAMRNQQGNTTSPGLEPEPQ